MIAGLYKPFQHWAEKGTVWLYSDPHFNDPDLPRNITTNEQIRRINSKVGRNDTLIILGDVGDTNCVQQLRGYKVLIMGNHDQGRTKYERHVWKCKWDDKQYNRLQAIDNMTRKHPECQYTSEQGWSFYAPFTYWSVQADNHLFDEVYEGPLMISEKLLLSHEPVTIPWAFNIHGHDHVNPSKPGHFNCCAEHINYTPVNLNSLIKQGLLADTTTLHRITIDKATTNKQKEE